VLSKSIESLFLRAVVIKPVGKVGNFKNNPRLDRWVQQLLL
jgi:hypothetical protein